MNRSSLAIAVLPALVACGAPAILPPDDAEREAASSDARADVAPALDAFDAGGTDTTVVPVPDAATDVTQPAVDSGHDAGAPDGSTGGFRHPGVLVSRAQLDFVKAQIMAGAAPWTVALARVRASHFGSTSYTPHPVANVQCGASDVPDIGCTDEVNDAVAAYSLALLWYHTGTAAYAQRAIVVMNAWSSTITMHSDSNAPLQTAWVAEVFTRAAEIIRYTYTGWAASDVARFATMLTHVYLPGITGGSAYSNGNWELSMADGVIDIGVFTDDHTVFDHGLALWRARVPAYIYLTTDGALPVAPPGGRYVGTTAIVGFWQGQSRFVDGLTQETCRDFGHVGLGLGAMVDAAETAQLQGVDLYGEQARRITQAFEFNTTYLNGAAVPSWLCGGTLTMGGAGAQLTFEIGYNEYATRLHMALPQTNTWVTRNRPTMAALHLDWETLTHAGIGSVGL